MAFRLEGVRVEALKMHEAGVPAEGIAEELNVSISTVYRYLRDLAVTREPEGWTNATAHEGEILDEFEKGESIAEIAARYNTTRYSVTKILVEWGVMTSTREAQRAERAVTEELIIRAYNSGQRVVAIAAQFGIGQAHIYTILARHGLQPSRRMESRVR